MEFLKTLDSTEETLGVIVRYQENDGAPNLGLQFYGTDKTGNKISNPKGWSAQIKEEYALIRKAFAGAGFETCSEETIQKFGDIDQQIGLEHPRLKRQGELEGFARVIMKKLGFEEPLESIVIPRKGYAERERKGTTKPRPEPKHREINFMELRNEFENMIMNAYPSGSQDDTKKATELSDALAGLVKKRLGVTEHRQK